MTVQMVVFDMAGTTVWDGDNAVARSVCEAVRSAGVEVEERDVNPVMGMPKPLAIRTLLAEGRGAEPTESEVAAVHADFQNRCIEHYSTSPNVREIDGATETFKALRERNIRVTLDTGFDRTILDAIVDRLGWESLIDDTIASDEVERGRPAPDLIHALMEQAEISNPAHVAKIGDSVSDIEQGLAAKCGLVAAMLCERTTPVIDDYPGVRGVNTLSEFLELVAEASGVGV